MKRIPSLKKTSSDFSQTKQNWENKSNSYKVLKIKPVNIIKALIQIKMEVFPFNNLVQELNKDLD